MTKGHASETTEELKPTFRLRKSPSTAVLADDKVNTDDPDVCLEKATAF